MIYKSLITIIASFGFGIIFNIKGKNLIFAAIGGGVGWFTYLLSLELGLSKILAMFLSSIVISIYSEIFARILKTPVTTLIVSALIPLVPGSGMYNTMYQTIIGNLYEAISTWLETLAFAGTLAIGIILVSTITKQISIINLHKTKKRNT